MRLLLLCAAAAVCAVDVEAQRRSRGSGGSNRTWEFLSEKYDTNKDGKVSWKEYARDKDKFASLDSDDDGQITEEDFARSGGRRGRGGRGRGSRGEGSSALEVGQVAPDFDLPTLSDGYWKPSKQAGQKNAAKTSAENATGKPGKKAPREMVRLSSFKGRKPVALIFGSYT